MFMRSSDAAQLLPGLFESQGDYYIWWLAKGNVMRSAVVTGSLLMVVMRYLQRTGNTPCTTLLRHLHAHSQGLSSERIAKISKDAMTQPGWNPCQLHCPCLEGCRSQGEYS
eukprot:NODE_1249_length_1619_cov_33.507643_g1114_i0.p2 GENE.NODE_1249_length_1619_cov_33.507643_g1114_i0~~NODE_1249_length_1619_cov_33.507643_g1114_i0.p2  ORF type:complete len:111 (+),score=1.38 NODE_1249_length_1619_cov_33.507643_g1114_i0:669-1001(+)